MKKKVLEGLNVVFWLCVLTAVALSASLLIGLLTKGLIKLFMVGYNAL